MTTARSPGDVLVVGGYGGVGITVTRDLAARRPGRVLVGGRDPDRARRAAGDRARPVRVDVRDVPGFERVLDEHPVGTVVLCVEPPGDGIARACLARGVHLVDVGASYDLLAQVETLHGTAAASGATAVLSVGVAPGLTNLLARRAFDHLGGADRIDVTVMLGAGERHGADSLRWTIAQLAASSRHRPAAGPHRIALPGRGLRTAHPFPFSDQHTLRRTLGVTDVTTRMCLDSAPLTAVLFGLRRAGAFRAARHPRVQRALTGATGRMRVGGDGFAVRVDAFHGDRRAACALTGHRAGHVTGLVAAHVAHRLAAGGQPPGVHHIDELPEFAGLPEELSGDGVILYPPRTPAGAHG